MPLDQLEQLVRAQGERLGNALAAQAGGAPGLTPAPPMVPPPGGAPMPEGEMSLDQMIDQGMAEAGMSAMEAPPELVQTATAALVQQGLLMKPSPTLTPEVLDALAQWGQAVGLPIDVKDPAAVMAALEEVARGD